MQTWPSDVWWVALGLLSGVALGLILLFVRPAADGDEDF